MKKTPHPKPPKREPMQEVWWAVFCYNFYPAVFQFRSQARCHRDRIGYGTIGKLYRLPKQPRARSAK